MGHSLCHRAFAGGAVSLAKPRSRLPPAWRAFPVLVPWLLSSSHLSSLSPTRLLAQLPRVVKCPFMRVHSPAGLRAEAVLFLCVSGGLYRVLHVTDF